MSVKTEHKQLGIKIEHDGRGYPQSILEDLSSRMQQRDMVEGRTGLGLYFARLIAKAHTKGEIEGKISLENGGSLGGSVFILTLP